MTAKNRTAQLIFQTVYVTLGLLGIVACTGVFDDFRNIRWDFYIHFTNVSNFFGIGIVLAELIQTARKKDNGYVTVSPVIKFIGMIGLILTFLIFNVLLAGAEGRDPQLNLRVVSIIFHVVLPIMYVADWFLFYERKKVKWFYPFTAILLPLCYAVFIYTHAAIRGFDTSILIPGTEVPLIYPYFFLDLRIEGILGVGKWFSFLFVALSSIGFLLFGIDRLIGALKRKGEKSGEEQ